MMQQLEFDIVKNHVRFNLEDSSQSGWRSSPELPTASELNPDWEAFASDVDQKLKANDIRLPYQSKEDYLETHYQILREEGITHLRWSIKQYRDNPARMDDQDISIYTKVNTPTILRGRNR